MNTPIERLRLIAHDLYTQGQKIYADALLEIASQLEHEGLEKSEKEPE